jgi:hypothetical protein
MLGSFSQLSLPAAAVQKQNNGTQGQDIKKKTILK